MSPIKATVDIAIKMEREMIINNVWEWAAIENFPKAILKKKAPQTVPIIYLNELDKAWYKNQSNRNICTAFE